MDQQRIQERLGTIVRAKEGYVAHSCLTRHPTKYSVTRKMVNVGSKIPFNLHNQTLPPEVNHTISRSASGSLDPYNYPTEDYDQPTHHQHTYPTNSYPRFSISRSPGPYGDVLRSSRSGSRERETKPILNIRLVGFVDRRGRARDRKPGQSPGTDAENAATVSDISKSTGSTTTETDQHSIPVRYFIFFMFSLPDHFTQGILDTFKLQETGAISLSWGD